MADDAPSFDIRYDPVDRILNIRLIGFWNLESVAAYRQQLNVEVERLRAQGVRFGVLSDARAFGVQSKEVSAGFDRINQRNSEIGSPHVAIVVATQLGKMQAQRVFNAANTRVFVDHGEARAWLLENRDTIA